MTTEPEIVTRFRKMLDEASEDDLAALAYKSPAVHFALFMEIKDKNRRYIRPEPNVLQLRISEAIETLRERCPGLRIRLIGVKPRRAGLSTFSLHCGYHEAQRRPIEVLQPILFAVLRALLPLLAFISLLFLTMLPFTGLEPLWQTRRAAVLLLTIVALMVLCTNAVYGDGRPPLLTTSVYPRWVRRVVELSLVALPAYALLALYALWLRVDQHGWTPDRLHGALAALLLAAHALGYAAGLLRPRAAGALPALASVNVSLSWLAMAVLVGTLTPLLDANRISVASQMARLESRLSSG